MPAASELTGRELDAAVAERVMGWKRWTCSDLMHVSALLARPDSRLGKSGWVESGTDLPIHENGYAFVPAYSAAGLVIEEMRKRAESRAWITFAEFLADETDCDYDRLMMEISPELICRAALAAMEAENANSR